MRFWPFDRKSDETATLAAPTDWLLSLFGMTSVNDCSRAEALAQPAVSAAIRAISEAAATLDIRVVKVADDGTETVDRNHSIAKLLDEPNPWTSTFDLVRDLIVRALTDDAGGLAWCNRVRDEVREIILLPQGRLTVEYRTDTGEPLYRLAGNRIDSSEVIHLRSPFGRAPLSMAISSITVGVLMEKHAKALFKNGARPGGWISMEKGLGDQGLQKMRAAWKAAFEGAENAGKTPILWDGAKFNPLVLSSVDSQFLELRTFQILEVARAFRVPPGMLFELTRNTWKNGEQQSKEFLTFGLEPWLRALEGALRRSLFNDDERKSYKIKFERDDLTRASLVERATAINSLRASQVLNPNEGRAWLDLPPYRGGDEYTNPNITVTTPKPDSEVDAPV